MNFKDCSNKKNCILNLIEIVTLICQVENVGVQICQSKVKLNYQYMSNKQNTPNISNVVFFVLFKKKLEVFKKQNLNIQVQNAFLISRSIIHRKSIMRTLLFLAFVLNALSMTTVPPAPGNACINSCPFGFKNDANCKCVRTGIPPVFCYKLCPFGQKLDSSCNCIPTAPTNICTKVCKEGTHLLKCECVPNSPQPSPQPSVPPILKTLPIFKCDQLGNCFLDPRSKKPMGCDTICARGFGHDKQCNCVPRPEPTE